MCVVFKSNSVTKPKRCMFNNNTTHTQTHTRLTLHSVAVLYCSGPACDVIMS